MTALVLVLDSFARTLLALASAPAQLATSTSSGAHLVIAKATLTPTGVCAAHEPMIEVRAVVENRGDAAFEGAPSYGLVGADMTRFGSLIGNGGTVPAIPAHAAVEIVFPIFYVIAEPALNAKATRYALKLDRYGNFPAAQMDQTIHVRTLPRPPCSAGPTLARG